uniref:Ubiquitin-like domain-containing protein n=1 Tax=Leersia perrieri TaxID=77586 RepID=A0A0D9XH50_9ORYZ
MAAGEEPEMVEVTLRAVGPSRPSTIRLPPSLSVSDLRRHIAHDRRLPEDRLRLVLRGRNLPCQDDALVNLRHGDSLMVAVAPKPPANHLRDDADDDDDEEELKFKIPETTTWWKRKIFIFLRDKLRLPDILLMALFSLNMKAWVLIAMWFLFAPIAQMYEVGPLYILGTGFVVILCNLGRRQQGDVSAYSIFNEDFRELPGTLNADRIDRDIRAGGKMINPPSNRQKYSLSLTPL